MMRPLIGLVYDRIIQPGGMRHLEVNLHIGESKSQIE